MPSISRHSRNPLAFQSTPSTEAGRCHAVLCLHLHLDGFNPRPALRLGDAFYLWFWLGKLTVSIHAQH